MIPPDKLVLLDTGILVELARGKKAGQLIDERYQLRRRSERPLICVVTGGEILALARIWNWGTEKVARLHDLLRELVIVDINGKKVLEKYGEIQAYVKQNGIVLGDNDVWIATAASLADAVLLTEDKDYDSLHGRFLTREFVDPASLK